MPWCWCAIMGLPASAPERIWSRSQRAICSGRSCSGVSSTQSAGRTMITATYGISGVLLIATAVAFGLDAFSAWGQTFAWMLIFFFASAAASSAYLTASEIFPLETRALAIAIFYALGTAVGGTTAPLLFGYLVQSGSAWALAAGYAFAASLMLVAAAIAAKFGIDAEMRSLESIAEPLSSRR